MIAAQPFLTRNLRYYNHGFTLVEFLIVFVITATIIGFAIPAFNNFNRTQLLKTAAAELKINLRQTQGKALSGEKTCNITPEQSTTELLGWYIRFDLINFTYSIAHHCYNIDPDGDKTEGTDEEWSLKTYTMKGVSSVDFSPANLGYILFEPVSKGVSFYSATAGGVSFTVGNKLPDSVAAVTITLTNIDGNIYRMTINRSGEISDEKIM